MPDPFADFDALRWELQQLRNMLCCKISLPRGFSHSRASRSLRRLTFHIPQASAIRLWTCKCGRHCSSDCDSLVA